MEELSKEKLAALEALVNVGGRKVIVEDCIIVTTPKGQRAYYYAKSDRGLQEAIDQFTYNLRHPVK